MANLEKQTETTTTVIGYTLHLTPREAEYLERALLSCDVRDDTVWEALDEAGIDGSEKFNASGWVVLTEK